MAESASGRYCPALEALAEYLPLLVTELRVWRGAGEAIIVPETVIANDSLDIAGPAGRVGQERTRDDWVAEATDEALRFVEEFVNWTQQNLGEVRRLQPAVLHRRPSRQSRLGAALASGRRRDGLPA